MIVSYSHCFRAAITIAVRAVNTIAASQPIDPVGPSSLNLGQAVHLHFVYSRGKPREPPVFKSQMAVENGAQGPIVGITQRDVTWPTVGARPIGILQGLKRSRSAPVRIDVAKSSARELQKCYMKSQ